MSYLYRLGHYSYEDSSSYELSCESQYTQEEFDNLIVKCSQEIYSNLHPRINLETESYLLCFYHIIPDIISLLIEKYHFSEIKYDVTFTAFGWGRIDKNDWKEDSDKNLQLIRKQIITDKFKKSR